MRSPLKWRGYPAPATMSLEFVSIGFADRSGIFLGAVIAVIIRIADIAAFDPGNIAMATAINPAFHLECAAQGQLVAEDLIPFQLREDVRIGAPGVSRNRPFQRIESKAGAQSDGGIGCGADFFYRAFCREVFGCWRRGFCAASRRGVAVSVSGGCAETTCALENNQIVRSRCHQMEMQRSL